MRQRKKVTFYLKTEGNKYFFVIPKKDGSLLDFSNLRPITLLSVDLKIKSNPQTL